MEKQKCPAVRFKNFDKVWDSKLIENILKIKSGMSQKSIEVEKGIYPILATGGEIGRTNTALYDKESVLIGRKGTIDKPYYMNSPFWTVDTLFYSELSSEVLGYFVYSIFQKINWRHYDTSTGVPSLTSSAIHAIEINIPDYKEQGQIGHFFQNLDQSIALHEKKLAQTQNFKKAMLEKMFPKLGVRPEIRLKGFSRDWEERKLKDISVKVLEKNSEHLYSETFTNSAQFGVISQRDFFDKDISNTSNIGRYYVVKDNDFVYNPRISNFAPVGPIKRNKLGRTGVVSPLYFVFRTHDVDHQFLETYFETSVWHKFMLLNGDTGARSDRLAIKDTTFMEMPIYCPPFEEQQKVGQFFKQLDDAINLQKQQLQTLKNIKQAFLEKMFV